MKQRPFGGRLNVRQTTPVPPLQWVPSGLPPFRAGEAFAAFKVEVIGGRGPKFYEIVDPTDLPPGMNMNDDGTFPAGVLRGDADGFWQPEVRVSAQGAAPISAFLAISVDARRLTIRVTPQPCPSAAVGEDYSGRVYVTVDGGDGVADFGIRSGTGLPTGLELTPVDQPTALVIYEVTGTPTAGSGLFITATVDVRSNDGQTASADIVIPVQALPDAITLEYPAFQEGTPGGSYAAVTPTQGGGVGPFLYSLALGAFGLQINSSTGAVSASALTAPAGFTVNDTVILIDQGAPTGAAPVLRPITIQMAAAAGPTITLTLPTFATAVPGDPYSAECTAGGTFAGNAVWDVTGINGLPPGISLAQSGVKNAKLTFTATAILVAAANKTYSGAVKVTDSLDVNNFAIGSWLINGGTVAVAFVPPYQTNTIPAVALTGATDETIDRVIASYWDDGDATDATYSIRQSSVSTYPVPAGVTLQMDGTDIGGTAQVVNGGIVNADIASSDNIRLEIVCDYTDPGTPVPGGDAEAAWANQAALSNLGVRCRFDTLTEVDAGGGDAPGLAHGPAYDEGRWGWDQGVRLSGAGSLRLEYWDTTGNPVGFGDGNGNNSVNWSHYLDGAGARRFYQVGDEVWLRFAARFNEAFIRQCPRTYGGTNPSTKVSIIDRFRGTAGNREVVITNSRARGVPAVYIGLSQSQAWTSGGGPVSTQSGVGSDYRLHPAYDAGTPNPATTTNEREQRYGLMYGTPNNDYVGPGVLGNVPDPDIGSFVFKPYVWHMFYQRIKITSEAGDQNGIYQLWAGDYGSNRVVNLISQTNVNYRINSPSSKPVNDKTPGNAGFSGFTLTPFQTDLNVDPGRLKVMTWYDEVLTRIGAGGFQHPGATGFITLPGIL